MKNWLSIIYVLILSACELKPQNEQIDSKSVTKVKKHENIFLNLDPKMDARSFDQRLRELNSEGILTQDQFTILGRSQKIDFTVSHKGDFINLDFVDTLRVRQNNKTQIREKWNNTSEILDFLLDTYRQKYTIVVEGANLWPSPFKDFRYPYYKVFQDSTRNIIFTYDIYDESLKKKKPSNKMEESIKNMRIKENSLSTVGVAIQIKYTSKILSADLLNSLKDYKEHLDKQDSVNQSMKRRSGHQNTQNIKKL